MVANKVPLLSKPGSPARFSGGALVESFRCSNPSFNFRQRAALQGSNLPPSSCNRCARSLLTSISKSKPKKTTGSETSRFHRRVRFEVDARNKIKKHVYSYSYPDDTDFHDVYLSADDMKQMKRDAMMDAASFIVQKPEYIASIECLLNSPLDRRPSQLTADKATQTLQMAARSLEISGMESRMSELVIRHQQWAISCVINLQRSSKLHGNSASSKGTPESLLRAKCERLNQGPKELALHLAKVHEIEARQIYSERELLSI